MATPVVQMPLLYKIRSGPITIGHVHFIAYKHPILMLRWFPTERSLIPLFRQHAALGTVLEYKLDWEGNQLWEWPKFRAQVSHGPDEQGQFELKVLDDVDLSCLNVPRR
jgi:hypothetical protein